MGQAKKALLGRELRDVQIEWKVLLALPQDSLQITLRGESNALYPVDFCRPWKLNHTKVLVYVDKPITQVSRLTLMLVVFAL